MRSYPLKKRGLIFSTLLLLLTFSGAQVADAHGYIVRSTPKDRSVLPRAPNQIQIWFSEGLEPRFSTLEVFNQQGEQVDSGDGGVDARNSAKLVVSLPSNLPPGAYLVKMRPVFSSDGHAVSDTMVFWIGEQVGSIDAGGAADTAVTLEAVWRVILTLSLITQFGTILTYAVIFRPAWNNPTWGLGNLPPRLMRRLSILLWGSLIAANVVNILALLQTSMALFETNITTVVRDELWNIVLAGTNFGDVWGFRTIILVAMLFIQIIAAQQARNRPGSTYILWLVNGLLAAAALATLSFISHAAGSPLWSLPSTLVDYLHLLAVSAWVGGLIVIGVTIRVVLAPLDPQARGRALRVMIQRFSALAVVAVSLIIVTGIYSMFTVIYRPRDLTGTTYGLTLLSKWILSVPLLGLGAAHFVTVSPGRMKKAADWLHVHQRFAQLPNTLRLEMLFALAVIFAAGWLPATPPPIPTNAGGEVQVKTDSVSVNEYETTLSVNPGAIGANSFDVTLRNFDEIAVDRVRIRFMLPEYGTYTDPIELDSSEPGLWVGAGGDINRAGTWFAMIDIYTGGDAPLRAALRWDFVEEVVDENSRSPNLLNWLSALAIVLVAGVWTAPLAVRYGRQLDWTPENVVITLLAVGMTLGIIVAGAVIFSRSSQRIQEQRDQPPEVVNPVFPDNEALSTGQSLYADECLGCHEANGQGMAYRAENPDRPIPSLPDVLYQRDDEDLSRILSQGIVNRHDFGTNLDEQDRWRLITFLRTLQ